MFTKVYPIELLYSRALLSSFTKVQLVWCYTSKCDFFYSSKFGDLKPELFGKCEVTWVCDRGSLRLVVCGKSLS